jgi:hypothetical protein
MIVSADDHIVLLSKGVFECSWNAQLARSTIASLYFEEHVCCQALFQKDACEGACVVHLCCSACHILPRCAMIH